jgi:hypothetical protein
MTTVTDAVLAYDDVVESFDPVLGLEVHVELAYRKQVLAIFDSLVTSEQTAERWQ